jgi:hypothetical protein
MNPPLLIHKNILFLLPHREIIIERIKDIIDPAVAVFVGF